MDEAMLRKTSSRDNPEPAWRRLEQACRIEGHKKIIANFGLLSDFYDQDMIALEFNGYEDVSKKLREVLPQKAAKILDLGCGPGFMGEKLKSMGYDNVYGIDATPEFIQKASTKNAYQKLDVVDLDGDTQTPYQDGFFDGVIAINVFDPDHVDQRAFPEINRLIRPGGFLVVYLRKTSLDMESENFNIKAAFDSYVGKGLWKRYPDEQGIRTSYYRRDIHIGLPEDVGVLVTVQKS